MTHPHPHHAHGAADPSLARMLDLDARILHGHQRELTAWVRRLARDMEDAAESFFLRAAQRTTDAQTRDLLGRLAAAEAGHEQQAGALEREHLTPEARAAVGITDGTIRISVGLEDPLDLVEDVVTALARLS